MSFFGKINSIVEKTLGFRMERIRPIKKLTFDQSENSPLLIEFMGASGVGKTTLRNYYLKNHQFRFEDDFLTEKDLKAFYFTINEKESSEFEIYNTLFLSKLQKISKSNSNFFKQRRRIDLFYKTLKNDFMIRHFIRGKTVVLDQHLFKFFTEDFIALEMDQKQELFHNRIIIYCEASPEIILKYIQKRSKNQVTRKSHQGKAEDKILENLHEHLAVRTQEIEILRKMGAQILKIDTAKTLPENTKLIDEFVENLKQKP